MDNSPDVHGRKSLKSQCQRTRNRSRFLDERAKQCLLSPLLLRARSLEHAIIVGSIAFFALCAKVHDAVVEVLTAQMLVTTTTAVASNVDTFKMFNLKACAHPPIACQRKANAAVHDESLIPGYRP
jgi:hypothetical protein